MVLESIMNPLKARRRPLWLFLLGILFALIAVAFSLWVFPSQASMVMVLLIVVMCVPLVYATTYLEEERSVQAKRELPLLKEHGRTIFFLSLLFLGFVVGFTLLYIFLPTETVNSLFSVQHLAIDQVNVQVSGGVTYLADFGNILFNNLKVLIFCVFFAFFFGAGAIFILAWNASVIATAIGVFFREGIAQYAGSAGLTSGYIYFHVLTAGIGRYMTHGIFEILAYFIGGLAGGIISFGLMKHGWKSPEFKKVLFDASILLIISLLFILAGGLVETLVTPNLF